MKRVYDDLDEAVASASAQTHAGNSPAAELT